ncbi:MAG: hypothetical protein HRT56_06210, partial [Coraliomargarita sp.]|nr:hypothetical protein [Coraliomargarita sp.]
MKTSHFTLSIFASCLSLNAQVVSEDFSSPSKNGGNSATGYLGTAGIGFDYNGNFGTWLYSSGNMGIADASSGDGSGSDSSNVVASTGQARVQDFRGTNARALSVVFEGSLFTDGEEYTVS